MVMDEQRVFQIAEPGQVGEVRRVATRMAEHLGLGEIDRGKIALVVTEAASNIAKHARAGELVVGGSMRAKVPMVEVLALDQGPGILDVDRALVDGYSTAGSPGT